MNRILWIWILRKIELYFKIPYNFLIEAYYFGIKVAYYNSLFWIFDFNLLSLNIKRQIKEKHFQAIYKYLEHKYEKFIHSYKTKVIDNSGFNGKKIWCCRWQGLDNAPDIVKICIQSIQKNKGTWDVIVLDKYNYKKYIDLPEFIIEKVNKGYITITHLSDILRMGLLKQYGGVWVDATMYIGDSHVFDNFVDVNLCSNDASLCVKPFKGSSTDKWCVFLIGGSVNRLFSFAYDFLIHYHKDNKYLINYYLTDYIIHIAYNNFDDCKKDIDNIRLKNNNIFLLANVFNEKFKKNEWGNIIKSSGFFKLTCKRFYIQHDKYGNITNYGYFLSENRSVLES